VRHTYMLLGAIALGIMVFVALVYLSGPLQLLRLGQVPFLSGQSLSWGFVWITQW